MSGLLAYPFGIVSPLNTQQSVMLDMDDWSSIVDSELYDPRITAESGAFVVAGSTAGLIVGHVLPAASGTFAITGTSASLLHNRAIVAASGAFVVAGSPAELDESRVLYAESGSFVISGDSGGEAVLIRGGSNVPDSEIDDNPFKMLLLCFLEVIQEAEDANRQLLTLRNIFDAEGAQLDIIGEIVDQPRGDYTDDDDYRRMLFAKVRVNRSSGVIEDIIAIADLVVDDDDALYRVKNWWQASMVLRIEGIAITWQLATILIYLLRMAKAGGVGFNLEYTISDPADAFKFDGDDVDGGGWGSTLDAAVGGKMASVQK